MIIHAKRKAPQKRPGSSSFRRRPGHAPGTSGAPRRRQGAMAELSLLPAVRKRAAGAIVVADGTSCRHQILDGADADAVHVARVLAMALQHDRRV